MAFVQRSAVYGGKPSNGAASVIGFNGHATDALPTSTYLDLEMHILTLRIASRHIPEAGAVCGSSARTDLCGGPPETAVPTAIMIQKKTTLTLRVRERWEARDTMFCAIVSTC